MSITVVMPKNSIRLALLVALSLLASLMPAVAFTPSVQASVSWPEPNANFTSQSWAGLSHAEGLSASSTMDTLVFANTDSRKIYRSTEPSDPQSWIDVGLQFAANEIPYRTAQSWDGQIIHVATSDGVWRSTDAAATWQFTAVATDAGEAWMSIASSDDGQIVVISTREETLPQISTDGGASFSQIVFGTTNASTRFGSVAVDGPGQQVVLVVREGDSTAAGLGVWLSETKGTSWRRISAASAYTHVVVSNDGTTVVASRLVPVVNVAASLDVFSSPHTGAADQRVHRALPGSTQTPVRSLAVSADGTRMLAGVRDSTEESANGFTYASGNRGETWAQVQPMNTATEARPDGLVLSRDGYRIAYMGGYPHIVTRLRLSTGISPLTLDRLASIPQADEDNVSTTRDTVVLEFDRTVTAETGRLRLIRVRDGAEFAQFDVDDDTQVGIEGSTVTLLLAHPLVPGETYALQAEPGVLSSDGVLFAGINNLVEYRFSTETIWPAWNSLFVADTGITQADMHIQTHHHRIAAGQGTCNPAAPTVVGPCFVTLAHQGDLLTSHDAETWVRRSRPDLDATQYLQDVVWGDYDGGRWVAVIRNGTSPTARSCVYHSTDAVNWVAASLPQAGGEDGNNCLFSGNGLAYGDGTFVIVGLENSSLNSSAFRVSSDGGETWQRVSRLQNPSPVNGHGVASAAEFRSIGYGNGRFVALTANSTASPSTARSAVSTDNGQTWTYYAIDRLFGSYDRIAYGNGLFVATDSTPNPAGRRFAVSEDGTTWGHRTVAGSPGRLSGIVYGDGRFVALGVRNHVSETSEVLYSADGNTWQRQDNIVQNRWEDVTFTQGRYVAVASQPTSGPLNADNDVVFMVSPLPAQAPSAPTNLSATPGESSVSVDFDSPDNDGGAAITGYEYSLDNGDNWTAVPGAVTTSPITIAGLTNGVAVTILLRAVNAAGVGAASTAVTATPSAPPVIQEPEIVEPVPPVDEPDELADGLLDDVVEDVEESDDSDVSEDSEPAPQGTRGVPLPAARPNVPLPPPVVDDTVEEGEAEQPEVVVEADETAEETAEQVSDTRAAEADDADPTTTHSVQIDELVDGGRLVLPRGTETVRFDADVLLALVATLNRSVASLDDGVLAVTGRNVTADVDALNPTGVTLARSEVGNTLTFTLQIAGIAIAELNMTVVDARVLTPLALTLLLLSVAGAGLVLMGLRRKNGGRTLSDIAHV